MYVNIYAEFRMLVVAHGVGLPCKCNNVDLLHDPFSRCVYFQCETWEDPLT